MEHRWAHHDNVEGSVKHIGHPSFPDNWTVLLGQVVNQHAEIEMGRLILRQFGTLWGISWRSSGITLRLTLLHVALLSTLCDLISVHQELDICRIR
jgi:hypothetical protein